MFGHTARAGRSAWRLATFAALALLIGGTVTAAKAETRVLKFYNLHTKEKGSFSYKSNGRYNSGELKKINWFLRDWRKGEQTQIDPRLLDLIWEAYRQSGSNGLINVVSSYRSPATNSMLRSRSSGVAKKSQHTLGKALDFYIPDVPLAKLREIGLKMQVGGVGYYPKSGSPFVHFDVGNARHWPRMNRKQLMAVFPNGNTVHVPSDGKPLPGYQQALASYKQRRGGSSIQVANAGSGSSGGGKTLLAMLFGDGDEGEDEVQSAPTPRAPVKAAAAPKVEVASVVPQSRPSRDLPGGVAVPVGDRFDTGAPASAAAPAQTEVAALINAQIPVPTWAPSRAVPADASGAPAAREDAVSTLVAALEEQASETVASGQMAYAVPTPGNRPQFETVLQDKPATAATAIAKVAPAEETMKAVEMAARAPSPRPQIDPQASKPVPALMTAAASSAPKPRPQPVDAAVAAAETSGKGGRVLNAAVQETPKPKVLDPQEAIASRFKIAALVSDTDRRAARLATAKPDAGRLVGNLPSTLFASGFAPAANAGKSDRFSGSAVNFLPMVKVGQ